MQNVAQDSSSKRVYLDNNATTFPSRLLKEKWNELLEVSGNPSSIHFEGRLPKTVLRDARKKIAGLLGCSPLEIVFNSGASEGNSSVLNSVFKASDKQRSEFVVSSVEHPSIMKAAKALQEQGVVVHYVPVNRNGEIDLNFLESCLSEKTALVSVMYANNETGVIFPIKEISRLAHSVGALMHSDCVQILGKTTFNFSELNLDYATFSGHKFYALKGSGFCYVHPKAPWSTLIHGSQERGRRGGTENVIGIAAMNIVLDEFADIENKVRHLRDLRDLLETKLQAAIPEIKITGKNADRVANTSSLVIPGADGDTLLMSLDLKGFSVSTGAACSSGSPEPSPVLLAMGLTREEAQSSLRVSVGWNNTQDEIESFVACLAEIVEKLRKLKQSEGVNSNVDR